MSLETVLLFFAVFVGVLIFAWAMCWVGARADERQRQILDDWNRIADERSQPFRHESKPISR